MKDKNKRVIELLKTVVSCIEVENYVKASYLLGCVIADLSHEECDCEEDEDLEEDEE